MKYEIKLSNGQTVILTVKQMHVLDVMANHGVFVVSTKIKA